MTSLKEPIAKVRGTGDGAREVTLSDDGESRVSSRLPTIVSLVVKVLKREASQLRFSKVEINEEELTSMNLTWGICSVRAGSIS